MSKTSKLAKKFKSEYEAAGMQLGNITIIESRSGHAFQDEQVQGNPKLDGVQNCKFVGPLANFQENNGKVACYINFGRNTTPQMKEEYMSFIENFLKANDVERGF